MFMQMNHLRLCQWRINASSNPHRTSGNQPYSLGFFITTSHSLTTWQHMATYGNWRLNNLTLHAHAGVTWAVSATSVASAPQQNVGMKGRTTYCKKIWGWRGMKIRLQAWDLHLQATSPSACDFWISILSIWPFVLEISQFLLVSTYVRGAHIPMSTSIPSQSHLHSKCGSATRRGQCGLAWAVQLEKLNI